MKSENVATQKADGVYRRAAGSSPAEGGVDMETEPDSPSSGDGERGAGGAAAVAGGGEETGGAGVASTSVHGTVLLDGSYDKELSSIRGQVRGGGRGTGGGWGGFAYVVLPTVRHVLSLGRSGCSSSTFVPRAELPISERVNLCSFQKI